MHAKVLTGRQKPLTEIAFLFAEIETEKGHSGIGFSYSKRAGGPGQYAHVKEIAGELIGEYPNDIAPIWDKLAWADASVGRSGLSTQATPAFDIALWDLKAKRAGLPLAKVLGAHRDSVQCYNSSGGYLSMPIEEVKERVSMALDKDIGAVKLKVGQPDPMVDLQRIEAVRNHIGNAPLAIDANQQWDRTTALRFGRIAEQFNLTWIEELLGACDSSFLKIMALADHKKLQLAPHYCMEIHLHLTAAYGREPWVEHFEWSEAMFNETGLIRKIRAYYAAPADQSVPICELIAFGSRLTSLSQ